MQIILAHEGGERRTRTWRVVPWQAALAALALLLLLTLLSGSIYHWFFLKAAREGWPVVSQVVRLVVRDDIAQRDKVMRDNLDALAKRVGEVQAKLVAVDAMSQRVAGLAGLKPEELRLLQQSPADATPKSVPTPAGASSAVPLRPASGGMRGGQGGLYLPLEGKQGVQSLLQTLQHLEYASEQSSDLLLLSESRLFEARLAALMMPSTRPVDGEVGSGFGFRVDPITGRTALHTGLDFPADVGTPIQAAAAGIVSRAEWHPAYGNTLVIDHGKGLQTLYAHNQQTMVQLGQLVKRGQVVATVGNTGRSTGAHLHFEVLVQGVPQDPARFLAGEGRSPIAAGFTASAAAKTKLPSATATARK